MTNTALSLYQGIPRRTAEKKRIKRKCKLGKFIDRRSELKEVIYMKNAVGRHLPVTCPLPTYNGAPQKLT